MTSPSSSAATNRQGRLRTTAAAEDRKSRLRTTAAAAALAALIGLLTAAHPARAQPSVLATGVIHRRSLFGDPQLQYQLYLPTRGGQGSAGAKVLVAVHGIRRGVASISRGLLPFAEQYGVVLVAPLFDEYRFHDYQKLGGQGARADRALFAILDEVGGLTGARTDRVYLFGYSGGAQFVHRFTMAHPQRVARVAVGAAGWYTFPDARYAYPYGIAPSAYLPDLRFDPAAFLRAPAAVFVGTADTVRDRSFHQSARVDAQQGQSRYERGQRWIAAMRYLARYYGLSTPFHFESIEGGRHSFGDNLQRGLGHRVFGWLFGPPPAAARVAEPAPQSSEPPPLPAE